ncbi:phosphoribosylglycinamide formyltransferase [Bacteroidetes/Chlorobi group bacterium MS-B_bin-24]|jgi:phosphoribosylglycinamide formyltransferase-1|nr:MAG: phosphoribosylglycinamide formyltransferase [Bacteroidetes/Chlorobi group bacterium MS-B_bin-24]
MEKLRIGFLASHNGSNLQAIIDAIKKGELDAIPCVVISNNSNAFALERARREGIPAYHISSKHFETEEELDNAILETLLKHDVNIVCLAGYMKKVGPKVLRHFKNRVLNIHPALLPKFGGKGMYGKFVHEAVLKAGETQSGCTVHLVDEIYDHGRILGQKVVPVYPDDTVETLSARVLEQEHKLYPEVLQKIAKGEIQLD